jgi:hypothetical protein
MQRMKIAYGTDPSRGVSNRAPDPRHQRWTEGEAARLVKAAWRHGYRGLASSPRHGDTQFSPVDVRTLRERHRRVCGWPLVFDRQTDGRAKTGRAADRHSVAPHGASRDNLSRRHRAFARRGPLSDAHGAHCIVRRRWRTTLPMCAIWRSPAIRPD